MIDILGFWAVVTIITLSLLVPLYFLLAFTVHLMVSLITRDTELANRVAARFLKKSGYEEYEVFNYPIHESILYVGGIGGTTAWVCLLLGLKNFSFLEQISIVSMFLAPYMGIIAVITIGCVTFVFVGRKAWKVYLKIDKVMNKLKDKE